MTKANEATLSSAWRLERAAPLFPGAGIKPDPRPTRTTAARTIQHTRRELSCRPCTGPAVWWSIVQAHTNVSDELVFAIWTGGTAGATSTFHARPRLSQCGENCRVKIETSRGADVGCGASRP